MVSPPPQAPTIVTTDIAASVRKNGRISTPKEPIVVLHINWQERDGGNKETPYMDTHTARRADAPFGPPRATGVDGWMTRVTNLFAFPGPVRTRYMILGY